MKPSKKPIFLFVGRSGSGKDYLKDLLIDQHGWSFVNSYATRKPRFEGEDTHIFITQEEADAVPKEDKVAYTTIGDYEYFVTRQQLENVNGYIIDPDGLTVLLQNMPDAWFEIMYIQADFDARKKRAINRGDDKELEEITFMKREEAEDDQFTAFEELSNAGQDNSGYNCSDINVLTNDFDPTTAKNLAAGLESRRRYLTNLGTIIDDLENNGDISCEIDENGNTCIVLIGGKPGEDVNRISIRKEKFINNMVDSHNDNIFSKLMEMTLSSAVNVEIKWDNLFH